jgi:uncharacterized BrkB/YihY/UPF0761 family membrane protein
MLALAITLAVVLVILWMISLYLIKTKKMKADEWFKHSLGIPQGSVRAIIALMLLSSLVYSIITGATLPDLPDWLVGILGTVIGFYFGTALIPRPEKKKEGGEEEEKEKEKLKPASQ